MRLFVTVGTTRFDALIEAVSSAEFQNLLLRLGYTRMTVQSGNSPCNPSKTKLDVQVYKYTTTIKKDIQDADLVVSHAGAGTILEALELGAHLVVCPNESLMDNHQQELCDALSDYLIVSKVHELADAVQSTKEMRPFPLPDTTDFVRLFNALLEC